MLAKFYSSADCSTTVWRIPIRFAGGYWARRQLGNGIRDVPVASKPRISLKGVLGTILAKLYSIADCSTTTSPIPIRFAGGCWAWRQLHAGIKYVPVASKLRISLTSLKEVLGSMLAEFYSIADYSTTAWRIPILFAEGCWAWCQLHASIRPIPLRSITIKLPLWLREIAGGIPGGIPREIPWGIPGGAMGKPFVRCCLYLVELEIQ